MLMLSIPPPQGHFGTTTSMSSSSSPTSTQRSQPPLLRPPTIMNPRRSMAPQCSKRPKLSLQTSILPQPVSPALPLACSADTPTSRNTLANSFKSPVSTLERADGKGLQVLEVSTGKETLPPPYNEDSARGGILKNTPLANLIRSRQEEKIKHNKRARITFRDEPQIIPRPAVDVELDTEADGTPPPTEENTPTVPNAELRASENPRYGRPRSDSAQWRRLRAQRSANEGRELRKPQSSASPVKPQNSVDETDNIASASTKDDDRPPQTPETPSPAHTKDWVWTLGDDFNSYCPYVPRQGKSSPASSPASTQMTSASSTPVDRSPPALTALRLPVGGRMPDTPNTMTPVTPVEEGIKISLPATPVTPESAFDNRAAAAPLLRLKVPEANPGDESESASTPRSVPLPETPAGSQQGPGGC